MMTERPHRTSTCGVATHCNSELPPGTHWQANSVHFTFVLSKRCVSFACLCVQVPAWVAVINCSCKAVLLYAHRAGCGLFVQQYSVWGNKTDLSMLVDASKLDEISLKSTVGQNKSNKSLIADDFNHLWDALASQSKGTNSRQPQFARFHSCPGLVRSPLDLLHDVVRCLVQFASFHTLMTASANTCAHKLSLMPYQRHLPRTFVAPTV